MTQRNAVWKYELNLSRGTEFKVEMPTGAKVLCVQNQQRNLCLWVQVDPLISEREDRRFITVGTGHLEIMADDSYIGTAQFNDGYLVIHVYERKAGS